MDGHCNANDPVFVRQVAIVCCGLHNVCERHPCPFEPGWLPNPSAYVDCCCSIADMSASNPSHKGFAPRRRDRFCINALLSIYLRKRCEDSIVHPTKTDTVVSRSANLRIQ